MIKKIFPVELATLNIIFLMDSLFIPPYPVLNVALFFPIFFFSRFGTFFPDFALALLLLTGPF
jgi:hypothetical protein